MKTTLLPVAALLISGSALADNNIGNVHTSKYQTENIEVHFDAPDNRLGACTVQLRERSYPNAVVVELTGKGEPGSPFSDRQWVNFSVPWDFRSEVKQALISCATQNGVVTKQVNFPAPPSVSFTLQSEANGTGGYNITGGVYVEGNAGGTYCNAAETPAAVGHELFAYELGSTGGFWANYISLDDQVDSLYHGYGQARFECHGEGGTTLEMLEFRAGAEGKLEFEQSTLTWY